METRLAVAAMGASKILEKKILVNVVHPECSVAEAAVVKPKEIAVAVMAAAAVALQKMANRLYLQVDEEADAVINHPDVVDVAAVEAEPFQGN